MINEYYFERPVYVKMTVDKRVLPKDNIKDYNILIKWNSESNKLIEVETFQFIASNTKEAIYRINELFILNGDIFKEIKIFNE